MSASQQFTRTIPGTKGLQALRDWRMKGVVIAFSGALALSGAQKAEAQTREEIITEEVAAFEADYTHINIVEINPDRYADPTTPDVLARATGSRTATETTPFTAYKHGLIYELRRTFDAHGTFDTSVNAQYHPTGAYFPNGQVPTNAEDINAALAIATAEIYYNALENPGPTEGSALALNFTSDSPQRVCVVMFSPHTTDEESFLRQFTDDNIAATPYTMADVYRFVVNHELEHCFNSEGNFPGWLNEAASDAFAITRHMQLNGDDGFAELIMSARQVHQSRAGNPRDVTHYTVPLLERYLPRLKEAYAAGKLDGLTPDQINDFMLENAFGRTPREITTSLNELTLDMQRSQGALTVLSTFTNRDQNGRLVFDDTTMPDNSPELRTRLQSYIDRENRALDTLANPRLNLNAGLLSASEQETVYMQALDDYIQTQSQPRLAAEGIQLKLTNMQAIEDAFAEQSTPEELAAFYQVADVTGVTFGRQREILQGYLVELNRQQEQAQQQTQEQASERDQPAPIRETVIETDLSR